MFQGVEKNHLLIEKYALALIVTARKMRPYFQSHVIIVLIGQPLKQVLNGPYASGRLVKWSIELVEFHIEFQPQITIKAEVLADFLVEMSNLEGEKDQGKWLLQVDGSSNSTEGGARIILRDPECIAFEVAVKLNFAMTNNEAEYEAIIVRVKLALQFGAKYVIAYTDSQLMA
ncbi:UNVERIFIED_CONTAM: hypothetical protein Sangu_2717300 [Sesamum angustifolium]|uniref:RNase H type-1 domain-containing protein n=1 Tax=Sesamum angustifolium TaxID=2727405 RepID=A0AAW2IYT0_9LAMI